MHNYSEEFIVDILNGGNVSFSLYDQYEQLPSNNPYNEHISVFLQFYTVEKGLTRVVNFKAQWKQEANRPLPTQSNLNGVSVPLSLGQLHFTQYDQPDHQLLSEKEVQYKKSLCYKLPFTGIDSELLIKQDLTRNENVNIQVPPLAAIDLRHNKSTGVYSIPIQSNQNGLATALPTEHLKLVHYEQASPDKTVSDNKIIFINEPSNISDELSSDKTVSDNKNNFIENSLNANEPKNEKKRIRLKTFQCSLCNLAFTNNHHLGGHMRATHTGEKPFQCSQCGKSFHVKRVLNRHIKIVHSEEKPYNCSLCNKAFSDKYNLSQHEKIHTGDIPKPHQCSICDKAFVRKKLLEIHMRNHTGEKPYQCDRCVGKFTSSYNLKAHKQNMHDISQKRKNKKRVSTEKQHQCTVCEHAFLRNSDLIKHMMIHTGEKPYQCKKCNRPFSRKYDLKKHMLVHNKESMDKPYQQKNVLKNVNDTDNIATNKGKRRAPKRLCVTHSLFPKEEIILDLEENI